MAPPDEDAPGLGELLGRGGRRRAQQPGDDDFDRVLSRFRGVDTPPPIPATHLLSSLPPPPPRPERLERVLRGLRAAGLVLLLGLPVIVAVHLLTHLGDYEQRIREPGAQQSERTDSPPYRR